MIMSDITFPVIHMNGSDRESLLLGYHKALVACEGLKDRLMLSGFHPRDYYVNGPEYIESATAQRLEMLESYQRVEDYLKAHVEHLSQT